MELDCQFHKGCPKAQVFSNFKTKSFKAILKGCPKAQVLTFSLSQIALLFVLFVNNQLLSSHICVPIPSNMIPTLELSASNHYSLIHSVWPTSSLQISWTKDGETVLERGSESGLSTIHIYRNGKLVIEVKTFSDSHFEKWKVGDKS